ncbi:Ketohexokinase [Orchesella cincta]|uniref:Ketohexokinase n=1 Tax=Orchesella cincta TaxID=48709 RepID=A0A1D2N438_ORCCI|nr:Ketohexokinase [Orchesella cincta]
MRRANLGERWKCLQQCHRFGLHGCPVECLGTLADDKLLKFLQEDMDIVGIKYDNCPIIQCGNGPMSVVVCSQATGSRTIIHAKGNLPELTLENIRKLNLRNYTWMQFEGRNEFELPRIMQFVREYNDKTCTRTNLSDVPNYKKATLPVSLEVELHIENLDNLLPLADVVLVGKDFAKVQGARDAIEAARIMSQKVLPGTVVICPWGDQGASYCVTSEDPNKTEITTQEAYVCDNVVDSLGAGDTFNATVIYCLNKGYDVGTSVNYACRVASMKLKVRGLKGLRDMLKNERIFQ